MVLGYVRVYVCTCVLDGVRVCGMRRVGGCGQESVVVFVFALSAVIHLARARPLHGAHNMPLLDR